MTLSSYVLASLLILTFISRNYLLQKQAIPQAHAAYLQSKVKERTLRNTFEIEKYEEYAKANKPKSAPKEKEPPPTKPSSKPHPPRTEKERIAYEIERTLRRSSRRSKLNCVPLRTSSELRRAAICLIYSLYAGTPLFVKKPAYLQELALLIIERLLSQKGDSVAERLKSARDQHPVLYKMLKGTSTYHIETKKGYPSLSDFLTINPKDPKAIHFHYASKPLLDVLFSERIRCIFFALELKKWNAFSLYPYVNKRETFAILLKEKKSAGFEELEPYLTFSR